GGVAVCDVGQVAEDRAAEPVDQLQIDLDVEASSPSGEVLVELSGDRVGAGRGPEQAGTDGSGEGAEDVVVVFALEGHSHQAHGRGRQEQRADGTVDVPVGDVEQPVAVGPSTEVVVQFGQVVGGGWRHDGIEQEVVGGAGDV